LKSTGRLIPLLFKKTFVVKSKKMLKELLKNTRFKSEIKRFYQKNRETVIDIVLFGSAVKGKTKPNDLDILLIFKSKVILDLSYTLRKSLEKLGFKAEITSRTYQGLFTPDFKAREAFLIEGYSLVQNKFISRGLGFNNFILFEYNLKSLNKSQRMMFYYALHGRKKTDSGILQKLDSKKFSENLILTPVAREELMKDFLNSWELDFQEIPALIPQRIK